MRTFYLDFPVPATYPLLQSVLFWQVFVSLYALFLTYINLCAIVHHIWISAQLSTTYKPLCDCSAFKKPLHNFSSIKTSFLSAKEVDGGSTAFHCEEFKLKRREGGDLFECACAVAIFDQKNCLVVIAVAAVECGIAGNFTAIRQLLLRTKGAPKNAQEVVTNWFLGHFNVIEATVPITEALNLIPLHLTKWLYFEN